MGTGRRRLPGPRGGSKRLSNLVRLHVGSDLPSCSLTGIQGTDDPRLGIDVELGDLKLYASAIVGFEGQRLGLQNDNDDIYYIFGGTYDLKPHRFGFDVVYFRDRFNGAETQSPTNRPNLGFQGQKVDSVWINAAWIEKIGPILGVLQGNLSVGTARGGGSWDSERPQQGTRL